MTDTSSTRAAPFRSFLFVLLRIPRRKGILPSRKKRVVGTSLVVQWLRLFAANAEGAGSIPGQGAKIPPAMRCSQKIKT